MSHHLRLVWSERIKRENERLASMGRYPDMPKGFKLDPPLYQSGLAVGDVVTINHPDMGGVEVEGEILGEIAQSGILVVQLPGVDGVVHVPIPMVSKS